MTTKQRVGHVPAVTDGRQLNCQCGTDKRGYWVWCSLHDSAPALLEALIKCRVALTPHVFIDDDARTARDLADNAIAKAKGEA